MHFHAIETRSSRCRCNACEDHERISAMIEDVLRRANYYARLRRVTELVSSRVSNPIRLRDAASAACMQEAAFSRYFTSKVGISFTDFLQLVRVQRALEFLRREDCLLATAAMHAGFPSQAAFARAFRKIVGTSPSIYRRVLLSPDPVPLRRLTSVLARPYHEISA